MKINDMYRAAGVAMVLMLAASPAMAQNLSPLQTFLQTLVTAITGPIGRLISILGVVATGASWVFGFLNMWRALGIVAGIVLIFSAATIVDGFAAG